jgi:predicted metal-dependent enzyme (double-stranded beta helix superfamily)
VCDTGYSVKRLVEDLRQLKALGEPELLEAARDRVKSLLLMKHNWLRSSMTKPGPDPSTPGIYKLHEEPDHSLAVYVVTWSPGEETKPHNHGTWAIVAGLDGWETHYRWKLKPGQIPKADDGDVPVVRESSQKIDAATIVAMDSDAIHSVHNDSGARSVTLNVYGMNPDFTEWRRFTPAE